VHQKVVIGDEEFIIESVSADPDAPIPEIKNVEIPPDCYFILLLHTNSF